MRNPRFIVVWVLLAAAVAGGGWWWLHHSERPPQVNAAEYETDMTEGLLRAVLREFEGTGTGLCFLAFGEGPTRPSRPFIARFDGTTPALQSCGAAESPPNLGKYFDKGNGMPGVLIEVVKFKEITPDGFDVVVAFSHLPAGQDRFTYRVSRIGGEWIVRNRKPA